MAESAPAKLEVDDEAAAFLSKVLMLGAFFLEFGKDQMRGVFPHGGLNLYPAGFRLISEGEQGRDLFVLYAGKVEVIRPFVQQQIFLGPGQVFGEMALLRDGKRTATVIAAEDSKIFHLPFQDLQYVIDNNPLLGKHLADICRGRTG